MQMNGFVQNGSKWEHPNGLSYSTDYINGHHSALFLKLMAEKLKGNLKVANPSQ